MVDEEGPETSRFVNWDYILSIVAFIVLTIIVIYVMVNMSNRWFG